jgi:predicted transcriptional regulator
MVDQTPPDRPDLYVVARMLERLWRENGPMLKTRLQTASNINYDVFRRYLAWMLSKGLVSIQNCDDGHERVSLTAKGEESYRKLVQWISEVIQGRMPGQ